MMVRWTLEAVALTSVPPAGKKGTSLDLDAVYAIRDGLFLPFGSWSLPFGLIDAKITD